MYLFTKKEGYPSRYENLCVLKAVFFARNMLKVVDLYTEVPSPTVLTTLETSTRMAPSFPPQFFML